MFAQSLILEGFVFTCLQTGWKIKFLFLFKVFALWCTKMLFPCNLKVLFRGSERSMIRSSRLWRPCCVLLTLRSFPLLLRLTSGSGMNRVVILDILLRAAHARHWLHGKCSWKTPAGGSVASFTDCPWGLVGTKSNVSSHIPEPIQNYVRPPIVACGIPKIADQYSLLYKEIFHAPEGPFFWLNSWWQSGPCCWWQVMFYLCYR